VEHEGEMFHFENPEKPHEQAIVPDVPLPDAPTGENEPADLYGEPFYDDEEGR
jgi:hypothetical protein